MTVLAAFLLGIIVGAGLTYGIVHKTQREKIVKGYETQIQRLRDEQHQAIQAAKKKSLEGSRAVIKGRLAEQMAPMLPGFTYLPSDARFIGDPVDYVVFRGYTDLKDGNGHEDNLEVVILDIKTGQSSLSSLQQSIARAVEAGRVRFEVVRPDIDSSKNATYLTHSQPLGAASFGSDNAERINPSRKPLGKLYRTRESQITQPRDNAPWTKSEDEKLRLYFQEGMSISRLAQKFQRHPSKIRDRLRKLRLLR